MKSKYLDFHKYYKDKNNDVYKITGYYNSDGTDYVKYIWIRSKLDFYNTKEEDICEIPYPYPIYCGIDILETSKRIGILTLDKITEEEFNFEFDKIIEYIKLV